jgi:MoaA/NifB/PqqE/SkfB family radical SAM enzyme
MPLQLDEGVASSLTGHNDSRMRSMPILILNVHGQCNCRCIMCDIWKRPTAEQFEAVDLDRHRASLRNLGVRQVVLSGGEPLLHKDLGALSEFFRRENIRLTLLTTGLLLFKRANDVSRLFDEVIVSVDGPREIHDAIRRVAGAFDLIGKGVAAVRAQRPDMRIACRTTVQKANHHHLRATVTSAKAMGFGSISFLAADVTSEAFNRPLVWLGDRQSEIALTAGQVAALEDEVEQLILEHAEDIHRKYIAETPAKLRRIVGRFRAHLGHAAPVSPTCNAPWVSAVIEVDGSVRPCFFHRSIGNIHSSSLEEVVNSEEARRFRESLSVRDNATCQRCVCSLNYQDGV